MRGGEENSKASNTTVRTYIPTWKIVQPIHTFKLILLLKSARAAKVISINTIKHRLTSTHVTQPDT